MVSKNAYYFLQNIASIRNTLCVDSAKALVHAFISSGLDYCNLLLYGLTKKSLERLQHVQDMAARLITGTKITDHITPVRHGLHWLPINQRIEIQNNDYYILHVTISLYYILSITFTLLHSHCYTLSVTFSVTFSLSYIISVTFTLTLFRLHSLCYILSITISMLQYLSIPFSMLQYISITFSL